MLATATLTTAFYVGSTFVAFNSQRYHDVFTERVPFGRVVIQFGQARHWDTLTAKQVLESGKNAAKSLQRFISSKLGRSTPDAAPDTTKETIPPPRLEIRQPPADRLKSVASTMKTSVERTEHEMKDKGRKAIAIARHQSVQFSEGVEELVRKAEAALALTAADAKPETTEPKPQVDPAPLAPKEPQPPPIPVDTTQAPAPQPSPPKPQQVPKGQLIYTGPLPIGFEPPPGYSAPRTRNRDRLVPLRKAEPRPKPLPQITPDLAQFGATDVIIVQLASTIDKLASYLKLSSSASVSARAALETAKMDLTELANRLEKIREEGQSYLEQKLDEQTKAFTMKLLELELEARDQIEVEKDGHFDEQGVEFRDAFRKKVDEELRRQTVLMNEQ